MMKRQFLQLRTRALASLALVFVLLLGSACGARQVNLFALPADDLYAEALELYERRRFEPAIQRFEVFVSQHLGDPRVPDARMMLGEAHMERREFATAAEHFQRMVTDFPGHARTLEARFRTCEAYDRLSPHPQRDQQYTISALLHCESVAENFPGTPESDEARQIVTELRDKLAQKSYDTGMFYFRRRAYDSAVVYFEEVVDRFPRTSFAPAALHQLAETYSRIGYVEDAEEARERLLREYPDSPEAHALRS